PIRHLPISSTTLTSPEYMPKQQLIPPPQSKLIPRDASFSINRAESKFNINDLQQRFKETSNANLGLFIARYYYDRGEYSEAYNYALKTNSINNKVDESWIIFSKSLVKLGRVDQAKKTLQLYISQSNSEAAHNLLDSIEKGNFK
ncbi:tetratricopeptide repeat protein, partial [Sulfuricurvum sp.]|uniref:tetratricopeptide repeat protein n=1 Tax=Sulfuricurvum sp. TaxID=2025608 RepID=UPI003BB60B9A